MRWPLKKKLILVFLAFSVIPLIINTIMNYYMYYDALTQDTRHTLLGTATQTAGEIDVFIKSNLDMIRTQSLNPDFADYLSMLPTVRRNTASEISIIGALISYKKMDPVNISSYALLDINGNSLFDTYGPDLGHNEAKHEYFKKPFEKGLPYASGISDSPITGRPSICFSSPIRNPKGNIVGILRVRYDAAIVQRFIIEKGNLWGKGSRAILLDQQHLKLADSSDMTGILTPAGDIKKASEGMDSNPFFTTAIYPAREITMDCAAVKMKTMPWIVISARPKYIFYTSLIKQLLSFFILLVTGIFVAVVSAIIIAKKISKPITRLTNTTKLITRGDLNQRVDVRESEKDEIGQLAGSFNEMVTILAERTADLERSNEALNLNFERSASLLKLNQMTGATQEEIMTFGFEEAVRLTKSKIGYLGLMNDDETVMIVHVWSRSVMPECEITGSTLDFPIATAGLWADVVRQRRPIIDNDYNTAQPSKKGYPEGHVKITRFLSVPVFDGPRIAMVAGIGNKEADYDETDVQQLTLLMEGLWRLIERNRADDALEESRREMATLLGNLPGMAYRCRNDMEWTMAFVSEGCHALTGYMPDDLVNNRRISYNDIIHPEDREAVWSQVQKALERRTQYRLNYRIVTAEGEVRWVWEQGTGVHSPADELVFLEGFITDITERKQAEEALRQSEINYRSVIENIQDVLYRSDVQGKLIMASPSFLTLLGYESFADCLGKPIAETFYFDPGKRRDLLMQIEERGSVTNYEVVLKRRDGTPITVETNSHHYLDGAGSIAGIEGTFRDITERRQAEEERRRLESQLIQAQKLEAVGTLAGGIAHDFNNILSGIMGYSELCLKAMQDRPKAYRHVEQILIAAERAKGLVRQILTFSRKAEQEKKPLALGPMVKEVVAFMRASLPTTIEITQKIADTSDVIMADSTQLHQVLVNLCTNAGHAMKETGGILEVGLEEITIKTDGLLQRPPIRPGHYLILTVRDTGEGIPEENLGRIFEPYFTTREKGAGTGLGLAVVHGIVKDHGGEIRVYSEVGKGTIFRVYLPLIERQIDEDRDLEEALLPGKGEAILFIDDEQMVVDLSRELLEELGYRVVTEIDPVKAIGIFREGAGAFDLVITDKTMPHLTGFEVAREIRLISKDIPILLCSGFQEKEDVDKLAALGISRLIAKPIRIGVLAKAIREVLDEKHTHRKGQNH